MNKVMYSVAEVKELIGRGEKLLLAGEESLLRQLPAGDWIAGTIPYFMAEAGGVFSQDQIYTTILPSYVTGVRIKTYDEFNINQVYAEAPKNGFSVIIIPATSKTHLAFALNAPNFDQFASRPLIGWISGVDLNQLGKVTPKVFSGMNPVPLQDGAVVIHIELPPTKYADINIINIFKRGDGDNICFPTEGFTAKDAIINGSSMNFADYLTQKKIDTRLPLVADYSGAQINISVQAIDIVNHRVDFYAPVFTGIEYRIAAPVGEYVVNFNKELTSHPTEKIFFSCNCILNYLYSELEGKQTGGITGPITFGEIAYQLLNQTLAYVEIGDVTR